MTDVVQQARDALRDHADDFGNRRALAALRAVVDAADAGHLIDARRLAAIAVDAQPVALEIDYYSCDLAWRVWIDGECCTPSATASGALSIAEREAR